MILPPLVERELRTGARRTGLFWLRGFLALVLGLQGYELLNPHAPAPTRVAGGLVMAPLAGPITGTILLRDMAWLLFPAVLFLGLLSADSISRERREGTLGLLLLTDLSPSQIVYGKLFSCGLTSFLVLLGALPALMVPVLAGGVRGEEAAIIGLGLLNALFVSLAAGLWMSAIFRERHHAVAAALGLIVALAFGAEVLGGNCLGRDAVPLARLFGLGGWITLAQWGFVFNPRFIVWLAATNGLGWFFMSAAASALARNWQDQPHAHVREAKPAEEWPDVAEEAGAAAPPHGSWLTDPRPWDADPVRWRVERMGSMEGLMWLAVALDFIGQFGAMGAASAPGGTFAAQWGLLSFGGFVVVLFASGLLAWAGARFFLDARRRLDLELLLTSTVGSRNVLSGQWHVLRKALKFPLGVVLLVAVPAGVSLIYDFTSGYYRDLWYVLPIFLIPVNLVVEVIALCWTGMYFGLRGRNPATAMISTLGLVQIVPLALAVVFTGAWSLLTPHSLHGRMPMVVPVLLFFLTKNVALIAWARLRLRRLLRLGARRRRWEIFTRRLIPQPA
jgi:hypothetical protein